MAGHGRAVYTADGAINSSLVADVGKYNQTLPSVALLSQGGRNGAIQSESPYHLTIAGSVYAILFEYWRFLSLWPLRDGLLVLSFLLVEFGLINYTNSLSTHLARMRQFDHLGHFFEAIKDVCFDLDVVFLSVVEHLLAVLLAGDESALDADVAEDEFLEFDGHAAEISAMGSPEVFSVTYRSG